MENDRSFQHNNIFRLFDELFHDFYAFQNRFYVFLNANGYQNWNKTEM